MNDESKNNKDNIKKDNIKSEIEQIEKDMLEPDFWADKNLAQEKIQKMNALKSELAGFGKYDSGNAVVTIFSGVGGDDAEDWSAMLLNMYLKFADRKNFKINFIDENQNNNGGYRSVTFEVIGKNAYKILKNESGVHRLVRISPFNSGGKRQTSFSMVEVIPQFNKTDQSVVIREDDLEIEYTKSSGPGGQNVNKRETAVRIIHMPTNLSVLSSNQRSQIKNKEKALEILKGKIYRLKQEQQAENQSDMAISKNTDASWGSQIRSYVLHPYKMVKDHRSGVETSNTEAVLGGDIDIFLEQN